MFMYKGFGIQVTESAVIVRDTAGKVVMTVETEKAAREWIDENND